MLISSCSFQIQPQGLWHGLRYVSLSMPAARLRKFLLFGVAFIIAASASYVQAQSLDGVRLEAARTLVNDKEGLLSPTQLFGMKADLFCRSYFADLRNDAVWGPNHPKWIKQLPDFCGEVLRIAMPEGQSVESYLEIELARGLTQTDLLDLNDKNSAPAIVAATSRLLGHGMSWTFVMQAERPPGVARMYSDAEREAARRTMQILRGELPGLEADLRTVASYIGTPAFSSYQRVMGQAFMNSAGRLDATPRGKFAALMAAWQANVSETAR